MSSFYRTNCKTKAKNQIDPTYTETVDEKQSKAENIQPSLNHMSTAAVRATSANLIAQPKKSANDFVFGKLIGDGSFSMVYLARDIHKSEAKRS